ncbi:aldo-keto reductase [Armillaria novae-zelandiae]|uniref:Aldo-keto reductase n=1 Tax=Armillaria novae-zelandiae TaxID=153914 RepID=A0AA39NX38_9AGAR|nr:aldo-keto reductase [Armillaria novae-zelandiae]
MMDDVLISQLPTPLLRSALRALVSQGSAAQKTFVEHVRARLRESTPAFPPAKDLFKDQASSSAYLSSTRCLFSSKMVQDSLLHLAHFLRCIPEAKIRWNNDTLELTLEKACGDIVQAVQALKESRPEPTTDLENSLRRLRSALTACQSYCYSNNLSYPFTRSSLQLEDVLAFLYPSSTFKHLNSAIDSRINVSVDSSVAAKLEYFQLGPVKVPRLFNGLWQMSSPAWGSASSTKQNAALCELVRRGLVATDMADHYGDAELMYGSFRNRLPEEVGRTVFAGTKWCVFRPLDGPVTTDLVLAAVKERSRRLGGRVELLQYNDKEYLIILEKLVGLTKSHPHLVSAIGLCNFDAEHTQEACEYLIAKTGNVGVVSNQVQYSLIDSRPKIKMASVCEKYGIRLLTYGSFCGGFLSEKWLGVKSPDVYSEAVALTPSQRKYFDMIMTWGSWSDLQHLLQTLKSIADKHGVELTNVATRWVLDKPEVGAVIVGTRLGVSSNADSNLKVFSFELTPEDTARIEAVALGAHLQGLYDKIGDCGHEYRH